MKAIPSEAAVLIENLFCELRGNNRRSAGTNHPAPAIVRWARRYLNFRNPTPFRPFPGSLKGVLLVLYLWLVPTVLTMNAATSGTVVAWGVASGGNFTGQTTVPSGLSGVTAISAGYYHTVALKSDGTVVVWGVASGAYYFGQTIVPAGLSGVTAIAAGGYHTVALKSDGTVGGVGRKPLWCNGRACRLERGEGHCGGF